MRGVRVKLNRREIEKLPHHFKVRSRIKDDAADVARVARSLAPRDTGAGAESIFEEEQPDGSWRVSWDQEHDYMRFQELGTEAHSAQPFLRPAADQFTK